MAVWKRRRLADYDYSQSGLYFVTICCQKKENFFWEKTIYENNDFELTPAGKIVEEEIEKISDIYNNVRVDNFVVMPNHIHLIIEIFEEGNDLSQIVNQTKGKISRRMGYSPWQASFHDHIIRGEEDYEKIWNYIEANPSKWNDDRYFIK